MNNLIDKVIIFFISLSIYIYKVDGIYMVLPILITVFSSAVISYKDNSKILITIFMIYFFICFFEPVFIFCIPLICYDLFFYKIRWLWALLLLPFCVNYSSIDVLSNAFIIAYVLISYILKSRTNYLENIRKNYYNISDTAKELSVKFEKKNRELLEKQDYEINLATLTERNRIARDIHDNVGHLLSRCLLQTGALLAVNKDEFVGENLRLIKDTLSDAMDSIRSSVHNLHDDSIDLYIEIQQLVDNFKFCHIKFDYDLEYSPENKIKYAFISITKEAFSNIIKHSNANEVSILLREHPAFYQLLIKDNGSNINYNIKNGIGIKNITDRVDSLDGSINISTDNGFRIFISIPKNLDRMV